MKKVVGLMSGTSMDGVDASYLETDGLNKVHFGRGCTLPYSEEFKRILEDFISDHQNSSEIESEITKIHAEAVEQLLIKEGVSNQEIDLIGFHGHTIFHDPEHRKTWQIGNGALLAEMTGIDVVCDFRSNDVLHGGQGAPLVPLYHKAMSDDFQKPLGILNLGGVANITWIDAQGELVAFDTGPGNALIDDFIHIRLGKRMDAGGELALSGTVDQKILDQLLAHPFFEIQGPKSLDRNAFDLEPAFSLSDSDGTATLSAFTAESVKRSIELLPEPPKLWLVTGGGRRNKALMMELRHRLKTEVKPVEEVGWQGDFLEAQAFGYLAVRSLKKLPLSLPSTTGVEQPMTGGVHYERKIG
ncbi:MAG: anhydro-N-acetylmuramic acid kinase [Deltaproteobacteria bacterium]|nr:anhydro-N-acetylmuramic acid kinase [Deltaproteobacteria bacterium]